MRSKFVKTATAGIINLNLKLAKRGCSNQKGAPPKDDNPVTYELPQAERVMESDRLSGMMLEDSQPLFDD